MLIASLATVSQFEEEPKEPALAERTVCMYRNVVHTCVSYYITTASWYWYSSRRKHIVLCINLLFRGLDKSMKKKSMGESNSRVSVALTLVFRPYSPLRSHTGGLVPNNQVKTK